MSEANLEPLYGCEKRKDIPAWQLNILRAKTPTWDGRCATCDEPIVAVRVPPFKVVCLECLSTKLNDCLESGVNVVTFSLKQSASEKEAFRAIEVEQANRQ